MNHDKKGKFAKGNKAQPKKLKPEHKSIRMALKEHIVKVSSNLMEKIDDLDKRMESKDVTALEYIMFMAIKKNDYKTIENFLDRVVGKPKTIINQKLSIKDLSDEKLEEMAKRVVLDGELDE